MDGHKEEAVTTTFYLPYDAKEPSPGEELMKLVDNYRSKRLQLLIGAGAKVRSENWGSMDTNQRSEQLLNYIDS